MPNVKVSSSSQLNNYVSEFGPEMFSTVGKILHRKIFYIKCGSAKRFNVTQHLTTEKHQKLVVRKKKRLIKTKLNSIFQPIPKNRASIRIFVSRCYHPIFR